MFKTLTDRYGKEWEGEYNMTYYFDKDVKKIRVQWPANPIRLTDRLVTYSYDGYLNVTKKKILYLNITNWEVDKVNHLLN